MKSKWLSLFVLNVISLFFVWYNLIPAIITLVLLMISHYLFYRHMLNLKIKNYESELYKMESTTKSHLRFTQVQSSQLETIIQNLPFPIALMDVAGNFTITNENFNGFYTTKPLRYNQTSIQDEIYNFIRVSYLKEEEMRQNIRLENMDIQAINVPIYEGQRYSGTLLMFLDITTLLEGERMQKRFIADASHELKTPLTSILGMVEILNRPDFNDRETLKDFLIQIEEESKRMESIIKDLIDLSKQSNTKIVLNMAQFKAKDLIESAIQSVMNTVLEHNNQIKLHCPSDLMIKVNPDKFHQIMTNLISNAAKYTQKGRIDIHVSEDEQFTSIHVMDTGIGISTEDINHIFDRFFRSDSSRSRLSGGSGLGLAIVKAYMNMHKAQISVSSEIDHGTTFYLKFPK